MKSLPIALDRLLSNPSYEQISGKLVKVSDDGSRAILELKNKKLKTLMGPFSDVDWDSLANKTIVAFVKEGEVITVFDARVLSKGGKTKVSGPSAKNAAPISKLRWKKYAEGRMVGERVKLASMERGFGLDMDLLKKILRQLGLEYNSTTQDVDYLDFRKVFHFLCEPGFRDFLAAYKRNL